MAVSTTSNEEVVALYDTTSGYAFGPTFESNDEAESFLTWLTDQADEDYGFQYRNVTVKYFADARRYSTAELEHVVRLFREDRDDND